MMPEKTSTKVPALRPKSLLTELQVRAIYHEAYMEAHPDYADFIAGLRKCKNKEQRQAFTAEHTAMMRRKKHLDVNGSRP